jgi:GT2 family glycosyltransferase/glycosyltransferase involved in cell wall biosynthesis
MDPLGHFLLAGAREGREASPLFDAGYYAANYPDVAAAGANPLIHFLRFGWKEGRRPNALFDATFYAEHNPGLDPRVNPFVDYVVRRQRGECPQGWLSFTLPPQSYQVATSVSATPCGVIDIIIPVHSGLAETRACLESVLRSTGKTAFEVVLVNDQAPNPALGQYLREMALVHGLTLVENPVNLGFAGSVNRGLELHPDRDIVVLNNDTEVAHDWLDRLVAATASGRIGTATPFSNNATLCSYPLVGLANPLPPGTTAAEMDGMFRQVNAGQRVRIPTAVGFCMYIRRDCLKEVGNFRAEIFGKGYGEENDFCLRATYKGWEHVLATDVFVYHAGETSFGSEAEERRKAGVAAVERLYPGYGRKIAAHLGSDPAKPYRVAVSAWRLRQSSKPVILSISHALGGGVDQYVREWRESLEGQAEVLHLTPIHGWAVVLKGNDFEVTWDVEADYERLLELLRRCAVSRIHVQHLLGHTLDIRRLKQDLGAHLDFFFHDYFALCPQVTLTDPTGRYCGEPDTLGCNACLAERPSWPRADIQTWREKYGSLVLLADRVIAPSQDAAARVRRYFPTANTVVIPHPGKGGGIVTPQPKPLPADSPLIIAVLGAMTPHKGIHRLRALASDARRQNLPLRFVLVGYVHHPSSGEKEPFDVTGPYNNDQLPELLGAAGAHLVWFPAQWPETFSYTLSACLETGMPVVAPDLGAFAERVAGRSWTWIIPWNRDTAGMIEFFQAVRRDHFLTGIAPPVPLVNIDFRIPQTLE